jgi:hypothetical protein
MKKIYVLLAIVIIMITACQKVPQSPDEEKRVFVSHDNIVEITVNAEVIMPDCEIPVVLIKPGEITMDFVEKAVDILLEGKTLYEPRVQLTKSEINAEIKELQFALDYPEKSKSDGLRSGIPENVARVTELFSNRIIIFKEIYKDAPEEYVPKEAVIEFKPSKYYTKKQRYIEDLAEGEGDDDPQAKDFLKKYEEEMQIILDANLDDEYYGRITASNFTGDLRRQNEIKFIKSKEIHETTHSPVWKYYNDYSSRLTENKAKRMMANLLKDLGIEGMELSSFNSYEKTTDNKDGKVEFSGFSGTFERVYYGVPTLSDQNLREYGYIGNELPRYKRELIKIRIANDEIVEFCWENPSHEVSVEDSNAELLQFDEIMGIFQDTMTKTFDAEKISRDDPANDEHKEYVESIEKGNVNINRIVLSMERVSFEGDKTLYKMIPVWKFFGSETLKIKGLDQYTSNLPNQQQIYLNINAIDGSILERG